MAADIRSIFTKHTRRRNHEDFNRKPTRQWQLQRQSHVSQTSLEAHITSALSQLETDDFTTAAVAREKSSLAPIRAIQHRDNQGNPIGSFPSIFRVSLADTSFRTADPDRSNPTRSRWERPLDTIRSFEAAIDGNYSRKSYMRTGQTSLSFNVDNTLSIAIMLTHFLNYRISGFGFQFQSSKQLLWRYVSIGLILNLLHS